MNSEELFKISKTITPGGVNSPVRAFEPYPFFVKEAKGSHMTLTAMIMLTTVWLMVLSCLVIVMTMS